MEKATPFPDFTLFPTSTPPESKSPQKEKSQEVLLLSSIAKSVTAQIVL